MPLLHRRIQVERVFIQDATVHVIRTQDGVLNTATIGKDSTLQPPGKGDSGAEGSLKPMLGVFAVEHFSITGGTLQYEDRSQEHFRSYQVDNLVFVTDSVKIGQTANIHAKGLVMPYRLSLEMNGRFGPLQPTLDVPVIDMVGRLGKVEATARGKVMDGRLELDVQIPKLSTDDIPMDPALPNPVVLSHIQAHLIAPLVPNKQLAHSSKVSIDPLILDLHLGGSTIHLTGKGTPGRLDMVGESSGLASQDFPLALSFQHPFVLEQVHFQTLIQGARMDLVSLNAKAFKGILKAHGKWDGHSAVHLVSLQGKLQHFAVELMTQAVQSSSIRLTGTGDLDWNVEGSWPPSEHFKLNGPVRLRIEKGQLMGFDFVEAFQTALRLPGNQKKSTGITKFSMINIQANLEHTDLVISQLFLDAQDFWLKGMGSIGFDRTLRLRGIVGLPPVIGDQVIRQYPMAKIMRQEGQMILPFVVKGTVQDPALQLDMQSLGEQVQKNVERRIEKALQGDDQELRQLLKDGEDVLKQLFGQ
jgi:hypothetical protein